MSWYSWYSWGSIAKPLPDAQNFQCLHWNFPEPFPMFCLEKCLANNRRCFADTSPNNRQTFADTLNLRCINEPSAKYLQSIGDYSLIVSKLCDVLNTSANNPWRIADVFPKFDSVRGLQVGINMDSSILLSNLVRKLIFCYLCDVS